MDENLRNIEDLFRSALEDNEETPSQKVWEGIDKRLDKDNIISIKKKYTNLKRIAAFLLLMLLSFALYQINANRNKRLAKSNNADSSGQKKLNTINDKALNKKANTNSVVIDTTNTGDNKKEIVTPNNSVNVNKDLTNQRQPEPADKRNLQKQNIAEITNSEKDISKNQTATTFNQKKKITNKAAYKVKVANPPPDEQLFVQNNSGQIYRQFPSLLQQENKSIEDLQLQSKDLIDTKKLTQLPALSKTKVAYTGNNAVAKTVKPKQGKLSRFSVTPFFSKEIAWHRLHDDMVGNQLGNAIEIEKKEKHEFAYTFGALVDYKINNHWGLQSGITLSITDIIVKPETIYAQTDNTGNIKYRINTSSGYGYVLPSFSSNPSIGDSLYALSAEHILHFIGIPLAATYNITKGKFKFNAMAGVSVNILTKGKLETEVEKGIDKEKETVKDLYGIKKMYFSGLTGIGASYQFMPKAALTFTPTLRFALNSINKNATVKTYPMSVGFAVGLKIGL